jgi:hypothetical protein
MTSNDMKKMIRDFHSGGGGKRRRSSVVQGSRCDANRLFILLDTQTQILYLFLREKSCEKLCYQICGPGFVDRLFAESESFGSGSRPIFFETKILKIYVKKLASRISRRNFKRGTQLF